MDNISFDDFLKVDIRVGKITRAEYPREAEKFAAYDRDGDGSITRADFSGLARRLIGRCAAGGWIQRWRSEHEDVEVARPRVMLTEFRMIRTHFRLMLMNIWIRTEMVKATMRIRMTTMTACPMSGN